jgi:acyl-CoA thioesterase II
MPFTAASSRLPRQGGVPLFPPSPATLGEWGDPSAETRLDLAGLPPDGWPLPQGSQKPMSRAVEDLLKILDLEQLEVNLFRGQSPKSGWQRVFGGQVIGQSLVAARRTVDGRHPHSLHGYFMRPGDPKVPIIYEVDRIRDGKSFTTRRVVAVQHGQAIFAMSASFQVDEGGFAHQAAMPVVPGPDELPSEDDVKAELLSRMPEPMRTYYERERPIDMRPVEINRYMSREPMEPQFHVWIRITGRLPDDPAIHQCVLAYASDMTLLDTSLVPHGRTVFDPTIQAASIDHAMWFHRPFRADEWLLYAQDTPNAGGARGFSRGLIFQQDGILIASVAQEGLIRDRGE